MECAGGCGSPPVEAGGWCDKGCAWDAWMALTPDEHAALDRISAVLRQITRQTRPSITTLPELFCVLHNLSQRDMLAFLVNKEASGVESMCWQRGGMFWDTWLNIRDR